MIYFQLLMINRFFSFIFIKIRLHNIKYTAYTKQILTFLIHNTIHKNCSNILMVNSIKYWKLVRQSFKLSVQVFKFICNTLSTYMQFSKFLHCKGRKKFDHVCTENVTQPVFSNSIAIAPCTVNVEKLDWLCYEIG